MRARRSSLAVGIVAAMSLAACLEESDEVGRQEAALTPVSWTDVVGVSASGNDLTKTAPETTFNAGAVSVESLSGDGYVEFTTGETTTDKACGLANGNGDQRLGDIDYAIRLNASGRVSIVEGGTTRASVGTYAAGDVFRVQELGEVVTYYRNGTLLYTSELAPGFPLMVDTSLRTPGATIQDAVIESLVFWGNVVGADAVGGDLTKTAPQTQWNAGAISVDSIAGDGFVEFRVADATTLKAAGLSNGDSDQSLVDIDFAFYLNSIGGAAIYEGGTRIASVGKYSAGDVFRVDVYDGIVTYLQNGNVVYTSTRVPSYPLVLDTSLRSPGARIIGARVVVPLDGCAPLEDSVPGSQADEHFGEKMDAAGDLLVIGGASSTDTVHVYRRGPAGWTFEQDLMPGGSSSRVDTDGTTILADVVSSSLVQVYRHDGVEWILDGTLTTCPGFGVRSFAVSGDRIVVGGRRVAYIYQRGASTWDLESVLIPPAWVGNAFGEHVAIGGTRVFVAEPTTIGSVFLYRYAPTLPDPPSPPSCDNPVAGKWRQHSRLYPSRGSPSLDQFPSDLDADPTGTRLVAGHQNAGEAYIFESDAGIWQETAWLRPSPSTEGVGHAVALGGPSDTVAVVGSSDPLLAGGAAFVFGEQENGEWLQIESLAGPYGFGDEVTASSDSLLVDDRLDDGGGADAGAVRVRDIDPVCLGP